MFIAHFEYCALFLRRSLLTLRAQCTCIAFAAGDLAAQDLHHGRAGLGFTDPADENILEQADIRFWEFCHYALPRLILPCVYFSSVYNVCVLHTYVDLFLCLLDLFHDLGTKDDPVEDSDAFDDFIAELLRDLKIECLEGLGVHDIRHRTCEREDLRIALVDDGHFKVIMARHDDITLLAIKKTYCSDITLRMTMLSRSGDFDVYYLACCVLDDDDCTLFCLGCDDVLCVAAHVWPKTGASI